MTKQSLLPDKIKFLSGSWLKIIAMMSMLCDHVAGHILSDSQIVLLSLGGHQIMLSTAMHWFGRMAFPIFCFLLCEGFHYTHSRLKYGINLLAFALISEIPWNLEHAGTLFCPTQNVFFTLFFGFLALWAIEGLKNKPVLMLISIAALVISAGILRFDYGTRGVAFIILLYALREHEILRIVPIVIINWYQFAVFAFLPISFYNGKRGFIKGKIFKYFFYAFYPLHIFVIYLIKYDVLAKLFAK